MPKALDAEQMRALEALIDASSVAHVVAIIGTICAEKAQHIRENWQDDALAKRWDQASRAAGRFTDHAAIKLVSL